MFSYPDTAPAWVYAGVTGLDGDDIRFTGVSRRFRSEQDARGDALRDAREQIAAFLMTNVRKEIQKVTVSSGSSSQILDPGTVQQDIATLLSHTTLLGTAGTQFYIQKWVHRERKIATPFWKAYVLVSFPEKENREIRFAILRSAAQRRVDRLEEIHTTLETNKSNQALPSDFGDRIRALQHDMKQGKHVEAIVQAQDLLNRILPSKTTPKSVELGEPQEASSVAVEASHTQPEKAPPSPSSPPQVLYPPENSSENPIALGLAPENRFFDPERREPFHLILDLKAPAMPVEGRNPVKLVLVLDTSGSMREDSKLESLREAAWALMREISLEDQISVVTFNRRAQVLVPLTTAQNMVFLRDNLDQLVAEGSTNLSAGLIEGSNQLMPSIDGPHLKRILVVTDGLANEGLTDPAKLLALVRRYRTRDVTLSTVGVGDEFNEDLLIAMADTGGGTYYYLRDPDRITKVLQGELGALRGVVAQNVRVVLKPSTDWRITEISNYEASFASDGSATFSPSDLAVGDITRVLFKAEYTGRGTPDEATFRAQLTYDDVAVHFSRSSQESLVHVKPSPGTLALKTGMNRDVLVQVQLAHGLYAIECAMECLSHRQLIQARKLLVEARDKAVDSAKDLDSAELLHQSNVIDELLKISLSGSPTDTMQAQLPRLRKLLAAYWYAASRNQVCNHCGVKHMSGSSHASHLHAPFHDRR